MRTPILLLALLAVLMPTPARAEDDPTTLTKALEAFFAEEDDAQRAALGLTLAMEHRDAKVVAAAAARARRWKLDGAKDKVVTWKRTTADGVSHTIFASIPPGYDAAKAWPVLIWLHGGVSREEDGGGASGIRTMGELADQEGFLVLAPSTQTGAEWWTPNGVALVRGALADLARQWRVDADRVAVSGFSDGASGCFHLLAHDPEPYCCFLPLMAHPGVTRLAGGPTFPANVRSRPVLAYSGGVDSLYPSARMRPLMTEVKQAGCDLTWIDLPEAGHNVRQVLPEHWDTLRTFWEAHPRVAAPVEVQWETAVPQREGRLAWVEILRVDPEAPSTEAGRNKPLPDPAGRPKLGVRLDRSYAGPGLKLDSVEEGSAAADAGFEAGDIITSVDGIELKDARAAMQVLVRALATMTDRDGVFGVSRGEEAHTLKVRPRATGAGTVERPKALGYGLPSGRVAALIGEENTILVTSRHVRRFKLHLADGRLDLDKPIKVVANGKVVFEGKVTSDTGYVLQQAARQIGGPAYRGYVIITL
ncbi:MAG: PDZ domain-containing protein [Planctomycetota bacterium]|nr:PDZ domain-containing protein [Planctomycetota bacterium]